jgi:hypothetical protein
MSETGSCILSIAIKVVGDLSPRTIECFAHGVQSLGRKDRAFDKTASFHDTAP